MTKRALVASPTQVAEDAERELRDAYDWVPVEQADLIVALGGDGYMLQTLHTLLERPGDPEIVPRGLDRDGLIDRRVETRNAAVA